MLELESAPELEVLRFLTISMNTSPAVQLLSLVHIRHGHWDSMPVTRSPQPCLSSCIVCLPESLLLRAISCLCPADGPGGIHLGLLDLVHRWRVHRRRHRRQRLRLVQVDRHVSMAVPSV